MRIHQKFIATFIVMSLSSACLAATAQDEPPRKTKQSSVVSPEKQREIIRNAKPMPEGTTFYIEAVPGPYVQYTILVTDQDHHTLPGNFVRQQLEIFEALLLAAKQFALTEEEAGTKAQPKVTRFMDKNEKAFIIDVQKAGPISRYFLTLQTLYGKLTIDAGAVMRVNVKGEKGLPDPLFDKIITRVQEVKNAPPPQMQQQ